MSPQPFAFPREFFFPPFFTRQTNLTTHHAQLIKWSSLILSYCRHHRIYKLSLSLSPSSSSTPDQSSPDAAQPQPGADELFHNPRIDKRLSLADIKETIDFMRKDGRAEYVAPGGAGGDVVWIYWRSPEEWAGLIEEWVDGTGQKGTVLTLYELTEGDATRGAEFHGLDPDLLQKALGILVKRGKAQIFGQEDSQGVKFF
ncbi:ESCRT-II complex, vps25 subunit [Coniochaeta ligniaria NRRL 30616]|uniref:ESCRT-II complex subunit VPS25 n=1 Tax=Coniochaeta ligniaria NRRL 30616 TaxID=1408157 RepID=A0A1J7J659_9PEZI|nr:ESCRT-II complex, vps25 subunit [Coniochaeta ligniaria NRRL 30616]